MKAEVNFLIRDTYIAYQILFSYVTDEFVTFDDFLILFQLLLTFYRISKIVILRNEFLFYSVTCMSNDLIRSLAPP